MQIQLPWENSDVIALDIRRRNLGPIQADETETFTAQKSTRRALATVICAAEVIIIMPHNELRIMQQFYSSNNPTGGHGPVWVGLRHLRSSIAARQSSVLGGDDIRSTLPPENRAGQITVSLDPSDYYIYHYFTKSW